MHVVRDTRNWMQLQRRRSKQQNQLWWQRAFGILLVALTCFTNRLENGLFWKLEQMASITTLIAILVIQILNVTLTSELLQPFGGQQKRDIANSRSQRDSISQSSVDGPRRAGEEWKIE